MAICSKYKIAYFSFGDSPGVWVEGKDTPFWRDQALSLAYCQNLAVAGKEILKNYLFHINLETD